jgi:hypothetical protein
MQLSIADGTARPVSGAEHRSLGERIAARKSGVWKGAWYGL